MEDIAEIRARHWFKRTCALCLCTCMFTLLCCVYCTVMLQKVQETNRAMCDTIGMVYDMEDSAYSLQTGKESPSSRESAAQRDVREMRLRRSTDGKSRKRKDKKKKPRKRKSKLRAAHYESMTTADMVEQKFTSYNDGNLAKTCLYIAEMAGTLCRTKDFVTNSSNNAIRAFKRADWVKEKNEPFTLEDNGFFIAKHTGVYLIYAQVLFYDNKEAEILRLVQTRGVVGNTEVQSLTCHQSVKKGHGPTYRSCGITGLFALDKHDVIYLKNEFGDVKLNLQMSTTYIGAVLLK